MTIYGQLLPPENFYNSKSNVMSKSNVKTLQYKQNIWDENYKYSRKQGIFNKE